MYLYPRLPPSAARNRIVEIKGRSPVDLGRLCTADSPQAIYPATGGVRVPRGLLAEVRNDLLVAARSLGFPEGNHANAVQFDWAAAPILLAGLRLHPAEACRNDVWSFLTMVLLPDLATWRFPNQNERRLLGGDRNTFQRLWWRAYLLADSSDEDPWRLLRLPEDAMVGLMERPGISSNPEVTRAIARTVATIAEALPNTKKEDGWRLAYKLIRQRIPLVNLDSLGPADLNEQLASITATTLVRMSS